MRRTYMSNLIDKVDDAVEYLEFRLEELKQDDVYYIKTLMKYIKILESELYKYKKPNNQ